MEVVKRIIWIAILVSFVSAAVVGGLYVRYLVVSKNFNDYWTQNMLSDGQYIYVAMGDSTAVGVGASSPQKGYVGQLVDKIQNETGKTVKIVNLAQPGSHIADVIYKQIPKLKEYKPDLVTVSVGANDINSSEDNQIIEGNFDKLIALLPVNTYIAEIPSFIDPRKDESIMEVNREMKTSAENAGMNIVPIYSATQKVKHDFSYLDFDLFHPNDKGYILWADAFWDALQ